MLPRRDWFYKLNRRQTNGQTEGQQKLFYAQKLVIIVQDAHRDVNSSASRNRQKFQHRADVETSTSQTQLNRQQQQQQQQCQQRQQQQHQQQENNTADDDVHSDDSYSSDFASDSADNEEHQQSQQQLPRTQKPSHDRRHKTRPRTSETKQRGRRSTDQQHKTRPGTAGSTQQRGQRSTANGKKPSRTRSPASRGVRSSDGSPTRSTVRQTLRRSEPDRNHDSNLKSEKKKNVNVERNGSPSRARSRAAQKQARNSGHRRKTSPAPHHDTEKHGEDGGKSGSSSSSSSSCQFVSRSNTRQRKGRQQPNSCHPHKTSSGPGPDLENNGKDGGRCGLSSSASSSSSPSESGSPGRRVNSQSPVHANNEYHLKYTDNDDIRQWLRSKNAQLQRQRKEKKRLERARRRQLQEEQQAKDERRKESVILVQRWMEEKRMESRMLSKRQQQNPKTLEHQQHGTNPAKDQNSQNNPISNNHPRQEGSASKPAKEQDEQKNPDLNNQGQKGSLLDPAKDQDGRNSLPVKDGKPKVPLFSRLGRYDTFPGAGTWTTPGKKMSEVERRKSYGDWLKRDGTGGLHTKDEAKLASVADNHEDQTKFSASSCVPHPPDQGQERRRRCTSGRAGRRQSGQGTSPRQQAGRPQSSKLGRIGTRLEPQGADQLDPTDESNIAASKSEKDNAEQTSPGREVRDTETLEKDSGSRTVPHVSFELNEEMATSFGPNVTRQDEDLQSGSENQNNSAREARLGPEMRSSRDLLDMIMSEIRPVDSEAGTSRSNRCHEEQDHSRENGAVAEDEDNPASGVDDGEDQAESSPSNNVTQPQEEEERSEERHEKERDVVTRDDGQQKTLATTSHAQSASSSSTVSISSVADDDHDNNNLLP